MNNQRRNVSNIKSYKPPHSPANIKNSSNADKSNNSASPKKTKDSQAHSILNPNNQNSSKLKIMKNQAINKIKTMRSSNLNNPNFIKQATIRTDNLSINNNNNNNSSFKGKHSRQNSSNNTSPFKLRESLKKKKNKNRINSFDSKVSDSLSHTSPKNINIKEAKTKKNPINGVNESKSKHKGNDSKSKDIDTKDLKNRNSKERSSIINNMINGRLSINTMNISGNNKNNINTNHRKSQFGLALLSFSLGSGNKLNVNVEKNNGNINTQEILDSEHPDFKKKTNESMKKKSNMRNCIDIAYISEVLKQTEIIQKLVKDKVSESSIEKVLFFMSMYLDVKKYRKNETVFKIGDKANKFYVIIKGKVDILKVDEGSLSKMNFEEYLAYLVSLKKKQENYILNKVLQHNYSVFPIRMEDLDRVCKDLFTLKIRNSLIQRPSVNDIEKIFEIAGKRQHKKDKKFLSMLRDIDQNSKRSSHVENKINSNNNKNELNHVKKESSNLLLNRKSILDSINNRKFSVIGFNSNNNNSNNNYKNTNIKDNLKISSKNLISPTPNSSGSNFVSNLSLININKDRNELNSKNVKSTNNDKKESNENLVNNQKESNVKEKKEEEDFDFNYANNNKDETKRSKNNFKSNKSFSSNKRRNSQFQSSQGKLKKVHNNAISSNDLVNNRNLKFEEKNETNNKERAVFNKRKTIKEEEGNLSKNSSDTSYIEKNNINNKDIKDNKDKKANNTREYTEYRKINEKNRSASVLNPFSSNMRRNNKLDTNSLSDSSIDNKQTNFSNKINYNASNPNIVNKSCKVKKRISGFLSINNFSKKETIININQNPEFRAVPVLKSSKTLNQIDMFNSSNHKNSNNKLNLAIDENKEESDSSSMEKNQNSIKNNNNKKIKSVLKKKNSKSNNNSDDEDNDKDKDSFCTTSSSESSDYYKSDNDIDEEDEVEQEYNRLKENEDFDVAEKISILLNKKYGKLLNKNANKESKNPNYHNNHNNNINDNSKYQSRQSILITNSTANNALNNFNFDISKIDLSKQENIKIFDYFYCLSLSQGKYFGDYALEGISEGRSASIVASEESLLGSLDSEIYKEYVHAEKAKIRTKEISYLVDQFFFKSVTKFKFERKYYSMFQVVELYKDHVLYPFDKNYLEIRDEKRFDMRKDRSNEYFIYFLREGEVELSMNMSLYEINNVLETLENKISNYKNCYGSEINTNISNMLYNQSMNNMGNTNNMNSFPNQYDNNPNNKYNKGNNITNNEYQSVHHYEKNILNKGLQLILKTKEIENYDNKKHNIFQDFNNKTSSSSFHNNQNNFNNDYILTEKKKIQEYFKLIKEDILKGEKKQRRKIVEELKHKFSFLVSKIEDSKNEMFGGLEYFFSLKNFITAKVVSGKAKFYKISLNYLNKIFTYEDEVSNNFRRLCLTQIVWLYERFNQIKGLKVGKLIQENCRPMKVIEEVEYENAFKTKKNANNASDNRNNKNNLTYNKKTAYENTSVNGSYLDSKSSYTNLNNYNITDIVTEYSNAFKVIKKKEKKLINNSASKKEYYKTQIKFENYKAKNVPKNESLLVSGFSYNFKLKPINTQNKPLFFDKNNHNSSDNENICTENKDYGSLNVKEKEKNRDIQCMTDRNIKDIFNDNKLKVTLSCDIYSCYNKYNNDIDNVYIPNTNLNINDKEKGNRTEDSNNAHHTNNTNSAINTNTAKYENSKVSEEGNKKIIYFTSNDFYKPNKRNNLLSQILNNSNNVNSSLVKEKLFAEKTLTTYDNCSLSNLNNSNMNNIKKDSEYNNNDNEIILDEYLETEVIKSSLFNNENYFQSKPPQHSSIKRKNSFDYSINNIKPYSSQINTLRNEVISIKEVYTNKDETNKMKNNSHYQNKTLFNSDNNAIRKEMMEVDKNKSKNDNEDIELIRKSNATDASRRLIRNNDTTRVIMKKKLKEDQGMKFSSKKQDATDIYLSKVIKKIKKENKECLIHKIPTELYSNKSSDRLINMKNYNNFLNNTVSGNFKTSVKVRFNSKNAKSKINNANVNNNLNTNSSLADNEDTDYKDSERKIRLIKNKKINEFIKNHNIHSNSNTNIDVNKDANKDSKDDNESFIKIVETNNSKLDNNNYYVEDTNKNIRDYSFIVKQYNSHKNFINYEFDSIDKEKENTVNAIQTSKALYSINTFKEETNKLHDSSIKQKLNSTDENTSNPQELLDYNSDLNLNTNNNTGINNVHKYNNSLVKNLKKQKNSYLAKQMNKDYYDSNLKNYNANSNANNSNRYIFSEQFAKQKAIKSALKAIFKNSESQDSHYNTMYNYNNANTNNTVYLPYAYRSRLNTHHKDQKLGFAESIFTKNQRHWESIFSNYKSNKDLSLKNKHKQNTYNSINLSKDIKDGLNITNFNTTSNYFDSMSKAGLSKNNKMRNINNISNLNNHNEGGVLSSSLNNNTNTNANTNSNINLNGYSCNTNNNTNFSNKSKTIQNNNNNNNNENAYKNTNAINSIKKGHKLIINKKII